MKKIMRNLRINLTEAGGVKSPKKVGKKNLIHVHEHDKETKRGRQLQSIINVEAFEELKDRAYFNRERINLGEKIEDKDRLKEIHDNVKNHDPRRTQEFDKYVDAVSTKKVSKTSEDARGIIYGVEPKQMKQKENLICGSSIKLPNKKSRKSAARYAAMGM